MTGHVHPADLGDDELLDLLGRALAAADPVPAAVVRAAEGAEAWRTVDADLGLLAELAFDSALDLAGARSGSDQRELAFQAGPVEIEILVDEGPRPSVQGQLVPAAAGRVELESAGGPSRSAEVDALGRFRFTEVPSGPVRFVATAGAGRVHSSWVLLRPSP